MKIKTNDLLHPCIRNRQHPAPFYQSPYDKAEAVCSYVVPAITRGDGIILIAHRRILKTMETILENRAIDVTMARASGQIYFIDAEELLNKFMQNGLPQDEAFYTTVSPILKKISAKFPVIWAYGEMVDILMEQENFAAVVKLEQLWTDISHEYNICILRGNS